MSKNTDYERFWFDRPSDLFRQDAILYFFPNDKMTNDQKLNAIMRFTIYFGVVILFIRRTLHALLIPLLGAIVTFLANKAYKENVKRLKESGNITEVFDSETNQTCTRPTEENPFMNVLVSDLIDNPTRPAACDIEDRTVKNKINEYFYKDLYTDIDDVFNRNASDRQFYTMPVTTIPNDSAAFAKWLYGNTGKIRDSYGKTLPAPPA